METIPGEQLVHVTKHSSSFIDLPCRIGAGTVVWHFTHIREGSKIGRECMIGQGCYIDKGVNIGDNVRIQNNVSIYDGVVIEDDVYIGPSVVFMNVRKPWATKSSKQYEPTVIKRGASVGANATILCGVIIGEGAMIGCGTVVNKNVPPHTMVVGNPSKIIKQIEYESQV